MLYMIGIGLADAKDITVKGLEAVRKADRVFLEGYTSLLQCDVKELEKLYGKPVTILDRVAVEQRSEGIIDSAKKLDVAFLVVGDVFGATTHTDFYLRAKDAGVDVTLIPNASIINAIGVTGLDLYKFGRTTTIVFPEKSFAPESFYDVITENLLRGLHTLCLLDIKADQKRYMTVPEAIEILEGIEKKRGEDTLPAKMLGCARLTNKDQLVSYATKEELKKKDWGPPPHCLVVPGPLHVVEEEMLS